MSATFWCTKNIKVGRAGTHHAASPPHKLLALCKTTVFVTAIVNI